MEIRNKILYPLQMDRGNSYQGIKKTVGRKADHAC